MATPRATWISVAGSYLGYAISALVSVLYWNNMRTNLIFWRGGSFWCGGSWVEEPKFCRFGLLIRFEPGDQLNDFGLRLILE